jgi:hypothetical protein
LGEPVVRRDLWVSVTVTDSRTDHPDDHDDHRRPDDHHDHRCPDDHFDGHNHDHDDVHGTDTSDVGANKPTDDLPSL